MSDASHILISGCSAGGLATFIHSDYIASFFPKASTKAAPVSGFFLEIPNLQDIRVYTARMEVHPCPQVCLRHSSHATTGHL